MNLFQRVILLVGLLAITGFCLCPPYQWEVTTYQYHGVNVLKVAAVTKDAGHYWIWSPPDGSVQQGYLSNARVTQSSAARIDWQRLSIYTGLMAAFCFFLTFAIFRNFRRQSKPSTLEK